MDLLHVHDSFETSLTDFQMHVLLLGLLARYGGDLKKYNDGLKFYTFFDLVESLERDRDCLSNSFSCLEDYYLKHRKIKKRK